MTVRTGAGMGALGRDMTLLAAVRLGAVAAGFLTSVLAARALGPTALGAGAVGLTAATIAALLSNGGLNIAAVYYLGRRPGERVDVTNRTFTMGLVAMLLSAAMVVLVGPALAPEVFGPPNLDLTLATALMASSIVAFELTGSVLLGHDRRAAYLITQVIEGIGSLLAVALVFALGAATAAGYVTGSALAALMAAFAALVVVRRVIRRLRPSFDARFTREALSFGLRGQVGNVVQMLNLRLDLLLVPFFVDLRAAGIYLIAVRMSEVVAQIASAAAALLFPAVSRQDVNQTHLTERTVRLTLVVVAAGGLVIGVLAPVLLALFFGQAFVAGAGALRITMIAMIPLALQRLMASDMKGRGRAGLVSISAACALIATVVFDVLLIPRFGIEGAALASVIAYWTGTIVLLVAYRRVTAASLMDLIPRPSDVGQLVAAARLMARRSR